MVQYFSGKSDRRRIFALYGLGGSGKSEISRKFVELAQNGEQKRYALHEGSTSINFVLIICCSDLQKCSTWMVAAKKRSKQT